MARPGITYDQATAAIDRIIAAGDEPTIQRIRADLGTGSPNTIHRHLSAWRAAQPAEQRRAPELPGDLQAALIKEIDRQAAGARAEIEARLTQTQAEAEALAEAGEALEAERDDLIEQMAALTTERDQAKATAVERGQEIERQEREIERERAAAEAARLELAKAQLKLEALAERQTEQTREIERLRADLATAQASTQAATQAAAVAQARQEAAQERAEDLAARLAEAKADAKTARAEDAARLADAERTLTGLIAKIEGQSQTDKTDTNKPAGQRQRKS